MLFGFPFSRNTQPYPPTNNDRRWQKWCVERCDCECVSRPIKSNHIKSQQKRVSLFHFRFTLTLSLTYESLLGRGDKPNAKTIKVLTCIPNPSFSKRIIYSIESLVYSKSTVLVTYGISIVQNFLSHIHLFLILIVGGGEQSIATNFKKKTVVQMWWRWRL